MLRALVALLLLANLGYWAWTTGALEGVGLAPARERDPARLAQQVRPQAVRVLPAAAAAAALGAASAALDGTRPVAATQCLEAGPFTAATIDAAERAVAAALPAGSWVRTSPPPGAEYAVVLGPFADRDAQQKKADEIARLRIAVEALSLPAPGAASSAQAGLALGRYDSRAAADAALLAFTARGLRTARVALLPDSASQTRLRIDGAGPALAEQARALSAGALGAGFAPCAASAPAR